MFFYESLLNQAMNGIDGTAIIPTIMNVAYSVLLLSFLFGVYQAFARGGDVRELGITSIKYLVVGLALAAYPAAFRSVNAMFNQLAAFIDHTSGATAVLGNWYTQLSDYWVNNGSEISWSLLSTTVASLLNVLLMVIGYILYPITYTVFAFFYGLYGSILYVVGPLILALLPVLGIGQLARTYLVNLMIFNGWGVIYAILGVLMTAINIDQVSALQADRSFAGQFVGLGVNTLIGPVSVFYSLAIALIPFIASRIVKGDVGATVLTMIGTAIAATKVATSTIAGAAGGAGGSSGGGGGGAGSSRAASPSTGHHSGFQSGAGNRVCAGKDRERHHAPVRRRSSMTAKPVPEKAAYTRYYEHDGLLRAYANRAIGARSQGAGPAVPGGLSQLCARHGGTRLCRSAQPDDRQPARIYPQQAA